MTHMREDLQIQYWAHMLDEAFNKQQFLCEDVEGKNINRAEKWIKQNRPELIGKEINGRVMSRARDIVTQIRHDIPSARLPYDVDSNGQRIKVKLSNGDIVDKGTCKYLPGVCRIYLNELPKKTNDQAQQVKLVARLSDLVNVIGLQFDKDFADNDQGRDFNGMSFDELEAKYGPHVEELKKRERDEAQSGSSKTKKNEDYTIVSISSFDDAKKFSRYVSWCVTKEEFYFDDYTAKGENKFYFVIRKDFKTVQKDDQSYATSMLAILIDIDGSMDSNNGCTSRLNNGGRFMNPKQVQDLLGVNFFETFKPRPVDELLDAFKKKAIPSKIADKLGGVETNNGLHIAKNGRVQTWKKAYDGPEGKCYAYDHFLWFDDDGNKIDAPYEVGGTFSFPECTSLTSLEGAPQKVSGDFSCSYCTSLISLEGAPQEVGGNFDCSYCTSLTSLEGAPQKVDGSFWCQRCTSLKSLEGAPQEVSGTFSCPECNSLISLSGAPQEVGGNFNCSYCKSLTSLEGAPKKIGASFQCKECNSLTSLEGAPKKIGGSFSCSDCTSLISLSGAPQEVSGNFDCSYCNSLTSLEGAPKKIGGNFECDKTKISHSQEQSYLSWLQKNPTENYHEL